MRPRRAASAASAPSAVSCLFLLEAAAAWPSFGGSGAPAPPGCCKEGPILVVGAGVAGLVTARSLQALGCNVTVFEALDHLGGRTHTLDSGPFAGTEEGAHWVHGGSENVILSQLLGFLGVRQQRVGGDDVWEGQRAWLRLFPGGGSPSLKSEDRDASFKLYLRLRTEVENYMEAHHTARSAGNLSVADAWREALKGHHGLRPEQLAEVRWHQSIQYEQDEGSRMTQLGASQEYFADYTEFYTGRTAGLERQGDAFVVGGYSELVRRLAEGLDVRVGAPVALVEHAGAAAVLHLQHPGAGGEASARGAAAVVTASVGALRSGAPAFRPPLPARKLEALEHIRMGNVVKLLLKYRPTAEGKIGEYATGQISPRHGLLSLCVRGNFERPGSDTLECFLGGEAAENVSRMAQRELRELATAELSDLFGVPAVVEDVAASQWSKRPSIGGAWSSPDVGTVPEDWDALAAPLGRRLHFAGEGTCRLLYGTVHAAAASGLRAALEVAEVEGPVPAAAARKWPLLSLGFEQFCTRVHRKFDVRRLTRARWPPRAPADAQSSNIVFF